MPQEPRSVIPHEVLVYTFPETKTYITATTKTQPAEPPTWSTLPPPFTPAPPDEEATQYHWDYHLGHIMPWKGVSNDPNLGPGFQQALADRRVLEPRQLPRR